MTAEELNRYVEQVRADTSLDLYIARRFTAATVEGSAGPELNVSTHLVLNKAAPDLIELLNHPRLVILGEPGAGKSLVARAAVQAVIQDNQRVPVFGELKGYGGNLRQLLERSAPVEILDPTTVIDGAALQRTYVLDGVDEVPPAFLSQFGTDLEALLRHDSSAKVVLTARQAFYVNERARLPQFPAVFHILDFGDDDIREYLEKRGVDATAFLDAVDTVDAGEEIGNPFVLYVMVKGFVQAGALASRRSDNLRYLIDSLIQSRPFVSHNLQRRALHMLALACETSCRNEITQDEALLVIRETLRVTDDEARMILNELHNSILRRTTQGLVFQMRSYGEYLAAEALMDKSLDRLKELAFDYDAPNESWRNTVSYLAEMNPEVRAYFVFNFPFWMASSSPMAFSEVQKTEVVRKIRLKVNEEGGYIFRHPRVRLRDLWRFVTPSIADELLQALASPSNVVAGNALTLLAGKGHGVASGYAITILRDRSEQNSFRMCAIITVLHSGNTSFVPTLISQLDGSDPLHNEILECIGGIATEGQIQTILPLLLDASTFLAGAFIRFQSFHSREALVQTLTSFRDQPAKLNNRRADVYLEPILKLLARYWGDDGIIRLCVEIIQEIERKRVWLDRSGGAYKLFDAIRSVDHRGEVATRFFANAMDNATTNQSWSYVNQVVVSLMTQETAQWLADHHATALIQRVSAFLHGHVRDLLRPFSGGLIDAQEDSARAAVLQSSDEEEVKQTEIEQIQERVAVEGDFSRALTISTPLRKATGRRSRWIAKPGCRLRYRSD